MPGLVDSGQYLLHDLVRQAGLLAQLGRAGPSFTMEPDERGILGIERQHLFGLAHDGLEIAVPLAVVDGDAPPLSIEQQLHAGEPALQLANAGDGSDGVERLGGHAFHVLPLRHREDQPIAREGGFDGPQSCRAPGANGRRDSGEENDFPERKNGQCQSIGH